MWQHGFTKNFIRFKTGSTKSVYPQKSISGLVSSISITKVTLLTTFYEQLFLCQSIFKSLSLLIVCGCFLSKQKIIGKKSL